MSNLINRIVCIEEKARPEVPTGPSMFVVATAIDEHEKSHTLALAYDPTSGESRARAYTHLFSHVGAEAPNADDDVDLGMMFKAPGQA